MALIKCPDCGQSVSDQAKACPKCARPMGGISKKGQTARPDFWHDRNIGCAAGAILLLIIFSWVYKSGKNDPSKKRPAAVARESAEMRRPDKQIALPSHKFTLSSRLGRSRSQLRAIVKPGTLTKAEFMKTAVRLCRKFESRAAGSFLVQFFSDASCLQGWDGTGGLRDSDWPHWLCRVAVGTDVNGQLYARTFKLAVNETTPHFSYPLIFQSDDR